MISIINKEVKEKNGRYYLVITLSESVNELWKASYQKALTTKVFTTLLSTGAPTVDKVNFYGNVLETNSFPICAMSDAKKFLEELSSFINIANGIYQSELILIKQKQEADKKKQEESARNLKSLNDFLNND